MSSKGKIIRNASMLFVRSFITIAISLYISRALLLKLGENDFGIFSVVGGIATIFSFIEASIFSSIQRFLGIALGEKKMSEYAEIFTSSFQAYLFLSVLIIILCETLGVYIINNVLNISPERLIAANYVFQFAVVSIVIGLTNGPYKASIIVHEDFKYFAYIDVIIKILDLAIVFLIAHSSYDKLIVYAALYMCVRIIRLMSDRIYCHLKFKECRLLWIWRPSLIKNISCFSGWAVVRNSAEVGVTQGNNIIINVFGGTIASASLGIGNQVWGTMAGFINNIQNAFLPQTIKHWGNGNISAFNQLIYDSMRYSGYMLIFMLAPMLLNMEFILHIWLSELPQHIIPFCKASLISSALFAMISPVSSGIIASGQIARYQMMSALILLVGIPVAYIFAANQIILVSVLIIRVLFQVGLLVYSSFFLSRISVFNWKKYLMMSIKLSTILLIGLSLGTIITISSPCNIVVNVILSIISMWLLSAFLIWHITLSCSEKHKCMNKLYSYIPFIRK